MTAGRSPIRLSAFNLNHLPYDVQIPSYDRSAVTPAIVHIGVGGFHRAHQAVYLDDLLHQAGNTGWGLCGVGLLKQDHRMRDALRSQDYLYTVVTRSSAGDRARVVGSIVDFLYAPEDAQAVIEKMASPVTRIVSLTITEGGYYVNQGTGELDHQQPDIQHDLANPHHPRGTFGFLTEALHLRRQRGLSPFTLMSCDNLQNNGDVARRMLLAFIQSRDLALAKWVAENGAFPNSMVDRITPATTDEHRALVRNEIGIDDAWPVTTEPFLQWVIEDRFPLGRPAWETVGAQLTHEVEPYEKMKIRLLNGSHQAMCYIGMLLGYQYAPEAMSDCQVVTLLRAFMDNEVTPLLSPVPGIDLAGYKVTLLERFANPAIKDQLARIGTEGSARIPKFVLPTILEQSERNGPIRWASFTVAAWFRYLTGIDDQGREMPINDPMSDKLCETSRRGGADPTEMLSMRELFGDVLPASQRFVNEVSRALRSFYSKGAKATLASYIETIETER
jgi:mannitol 2-dehydrogenase